MRIKNKEVSWIFLYTVGNSEAKRSNTYVFLCSDPSTQSLFNKQLLSTDYVPCTVRGARDNTVNKTGLILTLRERSISARQSCRLTKSQTGTCIRKETGKN